MREDAALSHRNACPFGTLGLTPPSRRWTSKTSVRGFERSWPQGRFRPTRTRAWRALRCNTEPYLMSAAWFVRKPHRTSCTRFGRASWFVSTPPAMRCGVRNVCRPERPNGPTYRGDALEVRIHPRSVGNPTLARSFLPFLAAWAHTACALTSASPVGAPERRDPRDWLGFVQAAER